MHVIGTRPNFVKMAPIVAALAVTEAFRQVIVHTGQHYDAQLSDEVLADLEFPACDHFLEVGSGSHGEQTAKILARFERVLVDERPEAVVVAGDVNSTLACALAAAKLGIPVAHVESGLRSGDWSMPEEINRVLTDRLADLLFTHSPEALANLLVEGVDGNRVHYVGNTMIDSLRRNEDRARRRAIWHDLHLTAGEYLLVTLHRPSNVDEPAQLRRIVTALRALAASTAIVFPIHPRTQERLEQLDCLEQLQAAGVSCVAPLGYLDFLSLQLGAGAVLTDSGGVQEEASALGVPCFTFRPNTERPVTLSQGTNTLVGDDAAVITGLSRDVWEQRQTTIPLWDGAAGERVAQVLVSSFGGAVAAPSFSAA